MQKIMSTENYKSGEPIFPGILYTGEDPIILEGKVTFRVLGTVLMNGVKISHTNMTVFLSKATQFELMPKSGILFMDAPKIPSEPAVLPELDPPPGS